MERQGYGGPEPRVLFENAELLALDKPAGLVVHSDGRTEEPALVDWLALRDPALAEVGGTHALDMGRTVPRFGVLHRIDRDTSGVILVAKTQEAFGFFQQQFLERTVEKTYDAIVWGTFSESEGTIDLPIGRSRRDFRQWTVPPDARGTLRLALTHWRVLNAGAKHAHLEVRPKTGRTHQIRVHLKAIGHPLVADSRYGGASALDLTRLALHARAITIRLPDASELHIEAPLPLDLAEAVGKL